MAVTYKGKGIILGILAMALAALIGCSSAAPQAAPAAPAAAPETAPAAAAQAEPASPSQPAVVESAPEAVAAPTPVPAEAAAPAMTNEAQGTLTVALDEVGPPKWIPKLQGSPQSAINNTTFWESLWKNEKDAGLVSVLAESWEISDDSTVWTIRLHQGVPFHHGYGEMTAGDFIWMLENATEEGTVRSVAPYEVTFFAEGGGMTALDDYTIEIDTVEPRWDLTWFLAVGMTPGMGNGVASQKYYSELGEEKAAYTQAVGTGPWRSMEHETGGTWRFEAVEDHWRQTPNFAELHYSEISEEATRLANFLAGKLDTGIFTLESIAILEDDCLDCKFMIFPTGAQLHINIHGSWYIDRPDLPTPRNPDLPWISADPDINSEEWARARKVRLAMNVAIDRQLLVETLIDGKGAPTYLFGWAGFEDQMEYLADLKYEYDPERARQLLTEAGYPDGIELPFALTNRPFPATIETAAAVATMWEDVGIRTTQIRQPMSAFRPNFIERSWEGVNSHGKDIESEPILSRTTSYSTRAAINYGVEHPIAEDLTERIAKTFDAEERIELDRQFAKFLFDEALTIPTVSIFTTWPVGPNIDEWTMTFPVVRVPSNLEYVPHRK
jgi:peptide/nickel transport system substrate-binding protein